MGKIGAHVYLWIDEWTTEKGEYAIKKAAEIGFDLIEIPLVDPKNFEGKIHRESLRGAGIEATASLTLPPQFHMPENPEGAISYLTSVLQSLREAGGSYLGGCLAYTTGKFTGYPPTKEDRQIIVDSLGEVAVRAKKLGMTIGLEVVSRIDTYLYNTLTDARETILEIGMDNVTLHADTYHMNLEEKGFYQPLVDTADVLAYIHMSESHRGLIGTGTIDWDAVFQGLHDAKYSGPLILESFTPLTEKFTAVFKTWRTPEYTPDELGRRGLEFLRQKVSQYEL